MAAYALAALHDIKGGWGGYKGGKGGLPSWGKGGKAAKGGPAWGSFERRPQWACPSCTGPNGSATLNRDNRMCCHRCGEDKPSGKGNKGLGKSAGMGGKTSARRGNSPIGADGKKPLLGRGGSAGQREETRVRGRTPADGLQGSKPRQSQYTTDVRLRSYADATRGAGGGAGTTTTSTTTATAPPTALAKGKGGPTATTATGQKGRDGEGRMGGYTTVDYRSGKKPRVGEGQPADERGDDDFDQGDGGPTEYCMDDEWWDGDEGEDFDEGEPGCDGDEFQEGDDHEEDAAEDEDHARDLEEAKQETRGRRELFGHLRRTLGRNHVHTRRAHKSLMEAEQHERNVKGPKTYWQQGRKDAKRKAVLLRLVARWGDEYDEREAQFEEEYYRHQERQQAVLDKITEAREELREIQERDEAYAKLQERGDADDGAKEDVPQDILRETANQVAVIIEAAGMGQIEQVTEQLNLLNARLCSAQRPPRQGGMQQSQQGDEARKGNANGKGAGPSPEGDHQSGPPSGGRWKGKSKGTPGQGKSCGSEAEGAKDEEIDRREAKLAARARGEGSRANMETDPRIEEPETLATDGAAAGAMVDEAKWKRALDTIRGRLQLAKNHKLAERQRQLIAEGKLPEPHAWTEEQLRENQKQIELSNAEVDAEAERELRAMSQEARTQLLEAAAR